MRLSQFVAAVVIGLSFLAGVGTFITLATSVSRIAVLVVLALVALAVVAASTVGSRSRRWLSNPYW